MTRNEYSDVLRSIIEAVSATRPDILSITVKLLERSPARVAMATLVDAWGVESTDEIAIAARKAAADLGRLSRWRTIPWGALQEKLPDTNFLALADLATARAERMHMRSEARRWQLIVYRLRHLTRVERTTRELEAWLNAPSAPVDKAWLSRFLERSR